MKLLIGLLMLSLATAARASGDAEISWRQDQDCDLVHHWELWVDGQQLSDLTGTCGGVMAAVVTVPGVGPRAFKIRALTATGIASAFSNEVVATIPFAAPALVGVSIP